MFDLLNEVAQKNGWEDFDDVVFNAKSRRTISQIITEAIELQENGN